MNDFILAHLHQPVFPCLSVCPLLHLHLLLSALPFLASLPSITVPPPSALRAPLSVLSHLRHSISPQAFHRPFSFLPPSFRPLCASLPVSLSFLTPLSPSLPVSSLSITPSLPPVSPSFSPSVSLFPPPPPCLCLSPLFVPVAILPVPLPVLAGLPPSPALSLAANEQRSL